MFIRIPEYYGFTKEYGLIRQLYGADYGAGIVDRTRILQIMAI